MKNQEIADILYKMAELLEAQDVQFKPYAYRKAAGTLEGLEENVEDIYKKGGRKALKSLPGVGEGISWHIEEYLRKREIKEYENLKKRFPFDIGEIIRIEGMGPKKAKKLWKELRIKNVKDLEEAAKAHKIASLDGFGEKTEQNILEGIEFLKRSRGRFLLSEIIPRIREIEDRLGDFKEIKRLAVAGSARRMKETIGDADLLAVSSSPNKVMDFFVSQPEVVRVWGRGNTKSSVRMRGGFDIDLRVVKDNQFGSALQYFTGSKEHNIAVRRIAMSKGMKLSEYGLFRGEKKIAGETEESIYKALGMEMIPPEMRENQGEVEAALAGGLLKPIGYGDIKGDLHIHSDWDGGKDSIKDIAAAAQKMGYQYAGIADHTKFLKIENGLDEKQLERRNKEIDKLNQKLKDFRILKGAEANILKDGSIDIRDDSLEKLDFVIAGIHSNFKMSKEEMTERMIKAIKNPNIDIISHPTGRILKRRDEYEIDIDKILKAAREFKVALEINSHPERLDLKDQNIRRAKEAGVKMVINTDSHAIGHLEYMEFGIAQARRGWAEKEDILNTRPAAKLLGFFNK